MSFHNYEKSKYKTKKPIILDDKKKYKMQRDKLPKNDRFEKQKNKNQSFFDEKK
jgi:hypothetical protein